MANSSISLTSIDFKSHKDSLKAYLREQDAFKDYDFEGSNINVLLDILSYNTYLNSFYLNMVGNEMFLDTAQLRDSVVSHAKELNYLPNSFTSAVANVTITIQSSDPNKRSVVIPRGTAFVTKVGSTNYTFTVDQNIVTTSANSSFVAQNVQIFEGNFQSDTFVVDYSNPAKYNISAKNVDISSIKVTVIEDNGKTQLSYSKAATLFGLGESSQVFFVQPSYNDQYEIVFGDGVIGRRPKNRAIIVVEYRVSNGELPNGANQFRPTTTIDGETSITVATNQRAAGGSVAESIEKIKYNAPRAFTTQERAVTAEDYENLLKINFPEINTVSAFGGEDYDPPQYGKVFITVDLQEFDGIPQIKKDEYYRYLKPRCPVAIDPVFLDADYLYVYVNSIVKYNVNVTSLNIDDIRSKVIAAVQTYKNANLDNFNSVLRYSKLTSAIDGADSSIISNETSVQLIKLFAPELNTNINTAVKFTVPLSLKTAELQASHPIEDFHAISSTRFTYNGLQCVVEDDGIGGLNIVTFSGGNHTKVASCGTINYDTGQLDLKDFNVSDFEGSAIKIYAIPRELDIQTSKNIILNILDSDIIVDARPIRV